MNRSPIVKPCVEKHFHQGNNYYLYNERSVKEFIPEMFSANYWQSKAAIIGTAQGRGTTYFLKVDENSWVLKHYYRGGLIGKLIRDHYLFTGFKHTRAVKEFNLLTTLDNLSLPAPKPVAVNVVKKGLFYQADIITKRIDNANDLVDILQKQAIDESVWHKIGACIQQFHRHGIYHHDLNIHNILLDENEKVWVIDFDQGDIRKPSNTWQQANLDRLLRSFNKEKQRHKAFHWQHQDWQALLEGYLQ